MECKGKTIPITDEQLLTDIVSQFWRRKDEDEDEEEDESEEGLNVFMLSAYCLSYMFCGSSDNM